MRNPFARWLERRDINFSPPDGTWFTGAPTDSGQVVSPTTALSVPAVFACCQILSQDVARTPLKLRQQTGPETYVDAVDHPLYEILNTLPNPEQTAFQFKAYLQWQLVTFGRAYAEIVRVDGRVVALWPLDAARMYVTRDPVSRVKQWHYSGGVTTGFGAEGVVSVGGPTSAAKMFTWTFDPSQPPILELVSETPITRCKEVIGSALALQEYVARYFVNGAKPSGVLTATGAIKEDAAARIRASWAANYGGAQNRGKVPVLDGGLTFTPISATNDDSQMTDTMKALAMAICGAFRIPPWKAGLMESTTYSNMESGELIYVTSTLDPFFELWEEALRRDVLTTRQYGSYTVTFDRGSLVRNDVKNLYPSLSAGIQNGFLSQNDARKALGLNPIPNGDVYMVNSALQPVGAPNVLA